MHLISIYADKTVFYAELPQQLSSKASFINC